MYCSRAIRYFVSKESKSAAAACRPAHRASNRFIHRNAWAPGAERCRHIPGSVAITSSAETRPGIA